MSVLRIWLGFALILAGIAKLHHPDSARQYLRVRLGVSPRMDRRLILALSVAELLVGIGLVAGLASSILAALSALMLLSSLALILSDKERRSTGCGCFGVLEPTRSTFASSLSRALLFFLVAVAVMVWEDSDTTMAHWDWPAFVTALVLFTGSVVLFAVTFGTPKTLGRARFRGDSEDSGGPVESGTVS